MCVCVHVCAYDEQNRVPEPDISAEYVQIIV
jgi:hypothetical protein